MGQAAVDRRHGPNKIVPACPLAAGVINARPLLSRRHPLWGRRFMGPLTAERKAPAAGGDTSSYKGENGTHYRPGLK